MNDLKELGYEIYAQVVDFLWVRHAEFSAAAICLDTPRLRKLCLFHVTQNTHIYIASLRGFISEAC